MPITDMLPSGGRGWRRWAFAAASILVHAALLAALVVSTQAEEEPLEDEGEEEVTFVDIRQFAPPPHPPRARRPSSRTPHPRSRRRDRSRRHSARSPGPGRHLERPTSWSR